MKITRTDEFIKLDQSGYIREILEKYDYLLRGYEGRKVVAVRRRNKMAHAKRFIFLSKKQHFQLLFYNSISLIYLMILTHLTLIDNIPK